MKLSIIIVNWNTRALLEACIKSVRQHTRVSPYEILVVDNASGDGSAEMVATGFPEVILIVSQENLGYSRGNNLALRRARGRYLLLLNPDTLLVEDAFSRLVEIADKDERIGAIGPKLVNRDGVTIQAVCARNLPTLTTSLWRLSGLAKRFPRSRVFGREDMTYWDHEESRYVEALSGACMMVRASVTDTVGFLDEEQFMYADDIDWCKRISGQGSAVFYCSEVKILHYHGESAKQNAARAELAYAEANRHYFRKHHGPISATLFCLLVLLTSSLKYVWRNLRRSGSNWKWLAANNRRLAAWASRHLLAPPRQPPDRPLQ